MIDYYYKNVWKLQPALMAVFGQVVTYFCLYSVNPVHRMLMVG